MSNEDTSPPSGRVTPDGAGAVARLGINSRWHPKAIIEGFYAMPLSQALEYAANIFKYSYWVEIKGYSINAQVIASKFADLAFNASVDQATIIIQRAANRVWPVAGRLTTDGVCGSLTVARINLISDGKLQNLYDAIIDEGAAFYEVLLVEHPEKFTPAQEGEWIKRLHIMPPA